jgi:hypothetical protein
VFFFPYAVTILTNKFSFPCDGCVCRNQMLCWSENCDGLLSVYKTGLLEMYGIHLYLVCFLNYKIAYSYGNHRMASKQLQVVLGVRLCVRSLYVYFVIVIGCLCCP